MEKVIAELPQFDLASDSLEIERLCETSMTEVEVQSEWAICKTVRKRKEI